MFPKQNNQPQQNQNNNPTIYQCTGNDKQLGKISKQIH